MSALLVAKQRLVEKEHEVKEQLSTTAAFRDDVKARNCLLSSSLSRRCEYLHDQFNILHRALEQKEKELLNYLDSEAMKASTFNGKLVDKLDELVDQAEKAVEDSKNVAQENDKALFFKECSHVSQKLEESFLDLLISNGQSEVEDVSEQPSRDDPTVDVTDALSCIRRIAFNNDVPSSSFVETPLVSEPGTNPCQSVHSCSVVTECQEPSVDQDVDSSVISDSVLLYSEQLAIDDVVSLSKDVKMVESSLLSETSSKPAETLIAPLSEISSAQVDTLVADEEVLCSTQPEMSDIPCPDGSVKCTSVSISESSETSSHLSLSIVECTNGDTLSSLRVPYETLLPGQRLQVLVTNVVNPSDICVQPYGTELVDLMEKLGWFYETLGAEGDHGGLLVVPSVGDFCCAQFTEDDCWYRALVIAVDQIYTTEGACTVPMSNVWVKVNYVDYGNQEQLPLSRLRVLDQSFCSLPCQALSCSVAGIEPTTHPLNSQQESGDQLSPWSAQINQWMQKLLLGGKVELLVMTSDGQNRVEVDIVLPVDWLYTAESLANFPIPVQSMASIKQLVADCSTIPLGSFMCIAGLAKPVIAPVPSELSTLLQSAISPYYSFTKFVCTIPVSSVFGSNLSSIKYVSPPIESIRSEGGSCQSEATDEASITICSCVEVPVEVHPEGHDDGRHSSEESPSLHTTADLEPLSITLRDSSEFCVLVSHVVSPFEFYVHPIQEDIASEMMSLTDSLSSYYSTSTNCRQLPPQHIESGVLCSVQLPKDGVWYRAVLTSNIHPPESGAVNQCSVQLVDYGETHTIPIENVYELAQEFSSNPPQVICCKLAGVQMLSDSDTTAETSEHAQCVLIQSEHPSISSDVASEEQSCSNNIVKKDAKLKKIFHSLVNEKQFVALVKDEGTIPKQNQMSVSHGCVVAVELYDTSGNTDINVTKYLLEVAGKSSDSQAEKHQQKELNVWNPMENDYLAQRNIYKIDDEDIGLALHGYSSTNRPCRFFKSTKGCFRGDECPYLHLEEGVSDKQLEEVYTSSDGSLGMPAVGDLVAVVVTAIHSATKFYIQMPMGSRSALTKQDDLKADPSPGFADLLKEMTAYYNQQVFSDQDVLKNETGEIIAARYSVDDQWYRARVINNTNDGKTKVHFVDYGDMAWVTDTQIRCIKPEFLTIPFQAVECYLPGLQHSKHASLIEKEEAKKYFEGLVTGKVLIARIVTKLSDIVLGLELYSDVHINKILVKKGFVTRVSNNLKQDDMCSLSTSFIGAKRQVLEYPGLCSTCNTPFPVYGEKETEFELGALVNCQKCAAVERKMIADKKIERQVYKIDGRVMEMTYPKNARPDVPKPGLGNMLTQTPHNRRN